MKRVLILDYEYPPVGGGGGVASKKMAEGYIAKGYKVDCVTTWVKGLKHKENINGVHVYREKVIGRNKLPNASLISLITFPIMAYDRAQKLCKTKKYEFIHTHFAIPTGPLGVWISRKFKLKNILSIYGGDIYDPTKRFSPHNWWILRKCVEWVINNTDVIVAESNNIKDYTYQFYNCKKEIDMIPMPYNIVNVPPKNRSELDLKENVRYMITVGRLVKRKGYDSLLKSFEKVKNMSTELIIIGDGPEKDSLMKLSEYLKISDRVRFLGSIGEEEKFQYLNNSDIYVLSSVHEGFGIVLQEAMQAGLAIVSTNNGGQVDFIKEGVNGYLVPVGDMDAMSKKMNYLSNNPDEIKRIGDNNLIKIKEFATDKIMQQYIDKISGAI